MNWKPISEKPEKHGWYLVWVPKSSVLFKRAYYGVYGEWSNIRATHWCEVTAPYGENGGS